MSKQNMNNYFSDKNLSIVSFDITNLFDLRYVKNYLRIDNDLDDEFLKNAISTACKYAEQTTGKIFGKKTLKLSIYTKKPISKIEENFRFDEILNICADGTELTENDYYLDNGVLILRSSKSGNISIIFKSGIDESEIDADLKQAMLYHIATIYQNKDGNFSVPQASQAIYNSYRNIRL